jgi:hypothetical protein
MTRNLGGLDRALRFLIAIGIAWFWYRGTISGTLAIVLVIVAIAMLLTSMIGRCPLYAPFHPSARKAMPGTAS